MRAVGFEPIGEEWPSVYIHEKLQLVLVVYVDDFKMAGPQKNLAQGWSMLRTRLKIEPETGLDMYLGCNQSKGNVTLGNGTPSNNGDLRHGTVPTFLCRPLS